MVGGLRILKISQLHKIMVGDDECMCAGELMRRVQ